MGSSSLERHSDAWYARCAELAALRGLVDAALVDVLDQQQGEAAAEWRTLDAAIRRATEDQTSQDGQDPDFRWRLPLALWSVASGSSEGSGYDVLLSVAWDRQTHRPYPVLACSCTAGRYGSPCSHIGCVLLSQDVPIAQDAQDAQDADDEHDTDEGSPAA